MKSDKGYHQTRLPCLYWFILLTGIVPFVVIFVVFNDIFYLVTTFVVLLTGAEAADKAISGARHLPDQGAVASREVDWLVKDPKAWDVMCEWWTSKEFKVISVRNRQNR
jgi:hypothetical protein